MPRSILNLQSIRDDDRTPIPGLARALSSRTRSRAWLRKYHKIANRYFDSFYSGHSFDEKVRKWKAIERFARHLTDEYNVSIKNAFELSTEYWKGRSS